MEIIMDSVTDEEMLKCLTKLVGIDCMMDDGFSNGCFDCPSQRKNGVGCILRIYRNQLKNKIIAAIKCDILQNETDIKLKGHDIEVLSKQNAEYEKKIKEIEG
jgi:hypothetical protein